MLEPFWELVGGNRWALNGLHMLVALIVPVVLVTAADRLIRRLR